MIRTPLAPAVRSSGKASLGEHQSACGSIGLNNEASGPFDVERSAVGNTLYRTDHPEAALARQTDGVAEQGRADPAVVPVAIDNDRHFDQFHCIVRANKKTCDRLRLCIHEGELMFCAAVIDGEHLNDLVGFQPACPAQKSETQLVFTEMAEQPFQMECIFDGG